MSTAASPPPLPRPTEPESAAGSMSLSEACWRASESLPATGSTLPERKLTHLNELLLVGSSIVAYINGDSSLPRRDILGNLQIYLNDPYNQSWSLACENYFVTAPWPPPG